jgi:predicted Zn-dependent protease with MMP-like domain
MIWILAFIDLMSDNTKRSLFKRERKFVRRAVTGLRCGMQTQWEMLHKLARTAISATLTELPKPLREQSEMLAVTFERVPGAGLQGNGIQPDTLGLFSGSEFADDGSTILPPQIMLFLENLWDYAGADEAVYLTEVRTTFLHELGHYFGLDEWDLAGRGLE